MIDINKLRTNPQEMKQLWATRNEDVDVEAILKKDTLKREKITTVEQLKSKRNSVSEQIGNMKKSGENASEIIAEMKEVSTQISLLDKEVSELENEIKESLLYLPNIPSATTPVGKTEDDNTDIRSWGEKPEFDFEPQAHWDLAEKLDIIDLPRGAKISGSGFVLYKNQAARLERALYNWFLDTHSDNGYTEYLTPYLVNRETMTGTGQLPKFEDDAYKTDIDDMFLIPTAEVPVTNIHAQEILEKDELPKYLTAYTPCWRREAGAAGKDTRGIIRVHQFNKVEMVKLVEPETSYTELETLVADAEQLLQNLGLHYRVIELCSGDLGFSAAKCYDIEVWAPGVGRYLEVSSCSNFEDFQSRRCNIRYRPEKKGKPQFIHTLNGSGLALPRCMVALLETYQNEDGSIDIPDILVPYMNGMDKIE